MIIYLVNQNIGNLKIKTQILICNVYMLVIIAKMKCFSHVDGRKGKELVKS